MLVLKRGKNKMKILKIDLFLFFQLIMFTSLYSQPTVLIDPGHGGSTGEEGDCVLEKTINLEESFAVFDQIVDDAYNNWMPFITRIDDDVNPSFEERYQMANNTNGEAEDAIGNRQ